TTPLLSLTTLFPYTTLIRSRGSMGGDQHRRCLDRTDPQNDRARSGCSVYYARCCRRDIRFVTNPSRTVHLLELKFIRQGPILISDGEKHRATEQGSSNTTLQGAIQCASTRTSRR